MDKIIKKAKDFKIIPNNFKSSGAFNLLSVDENKFEIKLNLIDPNEINDYEINSIVEVFGIYEVGLIYFETKILDKKEDNLTLAITQDYSIIQRREYSRVNLSGKVAFKDFAPDVVQKVEDISAGGIKLITNQPLETDKHYAIEISLANNMKIECSLQPIRIFENQDEPKTYTVSGKFINLENVDRIVLVQYAFKIKMEEQNKEND